MLLSVAKYGIILMSLSSRLLVCLVRAHAEVFPDKSNLVWSKVYSMYINISNDFFQFFPSKLLTLRMMLQLLSQLELFLEKYSLGI